MLKMDFSLAALKLLCVQLKSASQTPVIVSELSSSDGGGVGRRYLLDDGTGIIELLLSGEFIDRPWLTGMYVMVVGAYVVRAGDLPMLKVHKLVDLSPIPDREAMWYLEVMEAFRLFLPITSIWRLMQRRDSYKETGTLPRIPNQFVRPRSRNKRDSKRRKSRLETSGVDSCFRRTRKKKRKERKK
ncbi:hypothetical protein OROGR_027666 [Orobanche gracilis]